MQAIILAAGYGRRMRPLSDHCHKALLPVAGTTILGRIVEGLMAVDVGVLTVVTGYRADDIERFLRDGYPQVSFNFVHNERYAETNNIVSLSLALARLPCDDDVLLIECDLVFDAALLVRLVEHPAGNVALVDRYRPGMDGTVVSVAGSMITQVFPPHRQGAGFVYDDKFKTLNVYRFRHDFCQTTLGPLVNCYANQIDATCYYELVLGMLVNDPEHRIAAEPVDGDLWAEVDDANDLAVARFHFEHERRAEVLDRMLGGHWNLGVLDFSFMRNAYFPTEAMLAAMRHALPELIGAYGSSQVVINEKLGLVLRCAPARLQTLHGASQAFPILRERLEGRAAAIPAPTFGEFSRAFPGARTYVDAPGIDAGILDRLAGEADVLVVVNPNTPTGTTVATCEIYDLARRHPSTTVLVDESFLAFTREPSLIEHLERAPLANVIVLASLSKSLGVPGLRLGYLYTCDPALVAGVGDRLPVWNLGAPAEFLLELIPKFRFELSASLERTIADRERLRTDLSRLHGIDWVHPSGGNFLLVRLRGADGGSAAALRRRLLAEERIEVKDVTARFPDRAPRLRVAVRAPADNARLLAALGRHIPVPCP